MRGCGTLAGVCSGDPAGHEKESASEVTTFSGSALVIVRAADHPGTIEVAVGGQNVSEKLLTLTTVG